MGKCTGWVVAFAEKFPAAVRAAQALKVEVDPGPYGGLNTGDLFAEYTQTTKNAAAGANWVLEGDVDKALAGAEKVLEMEYTTDMVCHATMEPLNATVHFVDGAWHVYSGTQSTSFARMTLTAYLRRCWVRSLKRSRSTCTKVCLAEASAASRTMMKFWRRRIAPRKSTGPSSLSRPASRRLRPVSRARRPITNLRLV